MLSQYPEQVSSYIIYLTSVLEVTMERTVQSLVRSLPVADEAN
jgi:c-di-GMP-related signal transduction protein